MKLVVFQSNTPLQTLFFDCDLFWKSQSLLYGAEQVWISMWVKRLKFLSTFSQFRFWLSPKRVFFFQSWATSGNFSIGSLMEDCSLVATKKKQFGRQEFTRSIASFGGIGKSEFQIPNQRSKFMIVQSSLSVGV